VVEDGRSGLRKQDWLSEHKTSRSCVVARSNHSQGAEQLHFLETLAVMTVELLERRSRQVLVSVPVPDHEPMSHRSITVSDARQLVMIWRRRSERLVLPTDVHSEESKAERSQLRRSLAI
jgi:hypothetical protein